MMKAGLVICLSLCVMMMGWLGGFESAIASPQASSMVYLASSGGTVFKFSGKRPTNLGIKDGKLAACPKSPNCVCSQAPEADTEHWIAPLTYTGSAAEALAKLKSIVESMERTAIITETPDYLYAEFTSALMGFVDDVEFYLEPGTQTVQVRSASRLGQSDLGVNRNRIEAIRNQFEA
jgi:uncharacterized protein (DUF1499 family)